MTNKKYYVYCVKVSEEIVYIGKGSKDRYKHALSGISHNKGLNELYFKHQFGLGDEPTIHIIEYFDTSDKAYYAEAILIEELQPECNIRGRGFINNTIKSRDLRLRDRTVIENLLARIKLQSETISKLRDEINTYTSEIKGLDSIIKKLTESKQKLERINDLSFEIVNGNTTNLIKSLGLKQSQTEALLLYEKGCKYKYIAESVGVAEITVKRWVKQYKDYKLSGGNNNND